MRAVTRVALVLVNAFLGIMIVGCLGTAEPSFAQDTATMTRAFERFRSSFFADPYSDRDGLDLTALGELEGNERTQAEQMLIDFLPDTRAVIGLGVLQSTRAKSALQQLLTAERLAWRNGLSSGSLEATPNAMIEAAKALWLIHPDPMWLSVAIEALADSKLEEQRFNAAIALGVFRHSDAVSALTKALDDTHGLVRHHAARSLLLIHGLPLGSKDPENALYRIMADDPARREAGKQAILDAIATASLRFP